MSLEKILHLSNYFNKNSQRRFLYHRTRRRFSDKEIKVLLNHPNVKSVKIHDRIIKAETAVVLVLSIYKNFLALNT